MAPPRASTYAAVLTCTVLAGCSSGSPAADPPSPSPPTSSSVSSSAAPVPAGVRPVTKQWVDLQVGECIADVPAVDLGEASVSVVDCATPHGAEVYLLTPVAVNAAIAEVADQACAAGLNGYTGGRAGLYVTYLIDSKQDRTGAIPLPSTVICLLQAADGESLSGSVRG